MCRLKLALLGQVPTKRLTDHGAKASAVVYSLVETAKANRLKPYEFLKHQLTEIPKHMDDSDTAFLEDLLPWSDTIPDICRKPEP